MADKKSDWHLYPAEKPPSTGQYHCITKDGKQLVCDYGYSHLYAKDAFFHARGVIAVLAWKELEEIPEEIKKMLEGFK